MQLNGNVQGLIDLIGEGGSTVTVTPILQSGIEIMTITVDNTTYVIYAPEGGGSEVEVDPILPSGTKIATINVNGVDYDIYSTDYSGDISSLQTGLSTANSNITALQGRMTTAEGNITTLQSDMTAAEGDISTLQSGLSTANSNITTLQGRVTTAEGNITTLQSDMSAAESIIGDGQLDIGNDLTDAVNEINQSFADYFTKSYTITASTERAFIKDLATQAYSYMISKSLPFMLVNASWEGNNTGYMIISSTRRFQVQVGDSMSLGILNAAGTDLAQLRSVTTTAHP